LKRYEAIKEITRNLSQSHYAVFTTGMISREAFDINDRVENFYMIGSMGMASSFALGIAMNTKKKVVIFDGDGSALMEMGNLALIGYKYLQNIIHIVLDNGAYQSTGGQLSVAKKISLTDIAQAAGYRKVLKITQLVKLKKMGKYLSQKGPLFILVQVDNKKDKHVNRVLHEPVWIKERFKRALICEYKT